MEAQPGVTQPQSFPWRNLTTRPDTNGMIVNSVGYGDFGGLSGPGKYPSDKSVMQKTETGSKGSAGSSGLSGRGR